MDLYYYQVASDSEGFKSQFQLRKTQSMNSKKSKDIGISQPETSTSSSQNISHPASPSREDVSDSHANHNSLYTWGGETLSDVQPKRYSSEFLFLDEIEEVARLDGLVGAIRRKWPPGYYVVLRNKDISNEKHLTRKGMGYYPSGRKDLQPLKSTHNTPKQGNVTTICKLN